MDLTNLNYAPMNVVIVKGSKAAEHFAASGAIHPDALAPGFGPSPSHDLVKHPGKILPDLSFVNFFIAGDQAWNNSDIQNIDGALAAAMSDINLNNVMMQYFANKPITSKFLGSHKLPGAAPAVVSQGDAELLVKNLAVGGALPPAAPLDSLVVNLFLPPGTILTTDTARTGSVVRKYGPQAGAALTERVAAAIPAEEDASSEEGLGGYHGSIHLTLNGTAKTIYYAIGVFSQPLPNGTQNGIVAFPESWKNVVATFYHELNEARTDPDVEDAIRTRRNIFLGWGSAQGEEVGDFPLNQPGARIDKLFREVPLTTGSGTVPIQLMYSNAVHGPEGSIPTPHPLH